MPTWCAPAILHDVVVRSNRITSVAVALDEAVGVREVVENLTVGDNIEIPSINHFSTQGHRAA